ncbi:hypothetical protein CLV92_10298 [Kineococcus xinjiangensis]|uniref:Uncharacterized protein n=1 Tax=Kineococcus xinjiangensis TaxID=512762 RepID=A0A2S6IUR4_9ACTN|nr:hypothetical protein [Kineococcus xinjiangensis]PPK97948.1 hypothetical protein CLV92_10298 [Kineococcus xinjiangensis]
METNGASLTPQQALAAVADARAQLAERPVHPSWYSPARAVVLGALVASFATADATVMIAAAAATLVALMALSLAARSRTGTAVLSDRRHGARRALDDYLSMLSLFVVLGLLSPVLGGPSWPALPVALATVVGMTVSGRRHERALQADLRALAAGAVR